MDWNSTGGEREIPESQRQREEAERTASPKSASLAAPAQTPKKGSEPRGEADRPDKSWLEPKKERDTNKSPKGRPGVVDLSPIEEEGKASSGSKVVKEDRKTSRKRSRSHRTDPEAGRGEEGEGVLHEGPGRQKRTEDEIKKRRLSRPSDHPGRHQSHHQGSGEDLLLKNLQYQGLQGHLLL